MADHLLDEDEMVYGQYEGTYLRKKYAAFLNRAKNERQMQLFFETNPILLPGLYDRHNGPLGNVVISKLKLANEYETDLAFLSVDSAITQIALIEIESPTMKVFRDSDDHFTPAFNRSVQQMRDWKTWFGANKAYLKDKFREIYFRGVFRHQEIPTKIILIAGRRNDLRKSALREKRWAGINAEIAPNEIVTYDHLLYGLVVDVGVLRKLKCRPHRYIADELRRQYQ